MNIGIVGHEKAKFTQAQELAAREIICNLISDPDAVVVSGGCHLGGVDIWAEEEADKLGRKKIVFKPERLTWSGGYKERNLLIAQNSDVVHCIVVAKYPDTYKGMRFDFCYHCKSKEHIKSGGCWTAKRAKKGVWHVL